MAPTPLNVHRLLITGILLAAKLMDDNYFNNAYYAKVGVLHLPATPLPSGYHPPCRNCCHTRVAPALFVVIRCRVALLESSCRPGFLTCCHPRSLRASVGKCQFAHVLTMHGLTVAPCGELRSAVSASSS